MKDLVDSEQGQVCYIFDDVCLSHTCSAADFPALYVKMHPCLVPELILANTRNTFVIYIPPM